MSPRFLVLAAACFFAVSASLVSATAAEWTDTKGTTFHGKPVEILGPFAVFQTQGESSRRVLLRQLAPSDWIRFAQTAQPVPLPATLATAHDEPAAELKDSVGLVQDGKLVPIDCTQRPVPDILVVLYAAGNNAESWSLAFNFMPTYRRLRAAYPGRFDAVLFGNRTDLAGHRQFATGAGMPWLIADYRAQTGMADIAQFAPPEGIRAVAFSRHGVPLASTPARTLTEIRRFVDEITDLLYLTNDDNPIIWPDRLKYFNTVRPVLFADRSTPPLLIGSPLRNDVLRRKGVTNIVARIEVGVDGRATAVALSPDCGVPAALREVIADGLRRGALFSPAITAGQPVAGTYDFAFMVPPAPACSPADLAWTNGEARLALSLDHWLLLRPIPVPEQSFSEVTETDANGVSVLSAFEVSDEPVTPTQQRNSFNSDWFEADGAASLNPVMGDTVTIEGNVLKWQPALAREGFVDLQSFGKQAECCIGYAWTEVQVEKETDAWLAIGSDDGLKIWLNGELVHSQWIRRNSKLDDEIVPLHLKAGSNRLLIKIQNRTLEWSFVARLRTR